MTRSSRTVPALLCVVLFCFPGVARVAAEDAAPAAESRLTSEAPKPHVSGRQAPGRMASGSIGVRLGVSGPFVLSLRDDGQPFSPQGRLTISVYMGGDGAGWVFEPSLVLGSISTDGPHSAPVERLFVGGVFYSGPTFYSQPQRNLYLGFGFGPRFGTGGWYEAGELNAMIDLGVRVPFTLAFYATPNFALVLDAAVSATCALLLESDGSGAVALVAYDAGLGMRWP